ncbi:hypothetical protein [Rhodoferax sp.]|uniref:hypothetical protein n=1 Tax=Rhodoferax sp. TaxID=50421 RepID=UPI002622C89E|nr:hypothetical protein [Rhodoferax sp.]MDD2809049.1 hypothetical protein [Rhodoferax sp.]MDD4943330.1 hypothetical protein [Rhodoferax sp.]
MTMLLHEKVMFPVKPVPGRDGWYQIDGVPKDLGYADIGDWLGDEVYCVAVQNRSSEIVEDAKLAGLHDNQKVTSEDPRFNYQANVASNEDEGDGGEPDFVVVKRRSGELLCAMLINVPESVLLKYVFSTLYPGATEWQGVGDEWKRMDKMTAEAYEADVLCVLDEGIAEIERLEKEWELRKAESQAKLAAEAAAAVALTAAKKAVAAAKRKAAKASKKS